VVNGVEVTSKGVVQADFVLMRETKGKCWEGVVLGSGMGFMEELDVVFD